MFVLVVSKTFGPFVQALPPDDKYFLADKEILKEPIQTQSSKERKVCSETI